MKFAYGLCDFQHIIEEHYFYVDRTAQIQSLEQAGQHLIFLRPRRFGKSLLLSMLENYYDLAKADQFDHLFGGLAIGQQPTALHNQFFVLKWDFSAVSPIGTPEPIQHALYDHINGCIEQFTVQYRNILEYEILLDPDNAIRSLQSVLSAIRHSSSKLYLLIDEYDNFANEILMSSQAMSTQRYEALLYGEGVLKTVFKAIKAASAGQGLARVFITGVAPIVFSDITSGYNIAENISRRPEFQDLCGFWETDMTRPLEQIAAVRNLPSKSIKEALSMMRTFYDGYCFSDQPPDSINQPTVDIHNALYNSTLALYFLKTLQRTGRYPRQMLDSNLAMDQDKIAYIARLPYGKRVIADALNVEHPVTVEELHDHFGVKTLFAPEKSATFVASLLYYLGVLTLNGLDALGKLVLRVPNLVAQELYVRQIQHLLLPDVDQGVASQAAEALFSTGNLQPVCEFVEHHYFKVFDNRDYRWTNELTIKTLFLTLLFHDLWYIIDSEPALEREYADLVMIIRPDMRQYQLFDLLFEFKYLSLQDLRLSGEQIRKLRTDELRGLPGVQQAVADSTLKLTNYREVLHNIYGEALRLRAYTVVAFGFERILWKEFEG